MYENSAEINPVNVEVCCLKLFGLNSKKYFVIFEVHVFCVVYPVVSKSKVMQNLNNFFYWPKILFNTKSKVT